MGSHIFFITNWILPIHCNVDGTRMLNFGEQNNTLKMILVSPSQTIKLPKGAKKMMSMI
jgi:hypothetical protein